MDKILNENHIRIKEKAADWEEAIRKAGAVLVEAGSIRPAYVEKMIQSVREKRCGVDNPGCTGGIWFSK